MMISKMSESKRRNINFPKHCRGCKNLGKLVMIDRKNKRILECVYAIWGKSFIKDCPCGKCLVKGICTQRCSELQKAAYEHRKM